MRITEVKAEVAAARPTPGDTEWSAWPAALGTRTKL